MSVKLLPLLQTLPAIQQGDSRSTLIGAAIFGLFILILVVAGRKSTGSSGGTGKKVSRKKVKNLASNRGLDKQETHLLQEVASRANTTVPRLLNSQSALDSALRKSFAALETELQKGIDKEQRKLQLYRIKQKLEISSSGGTGNLTNTKQIPLGQQISIQDDSGQRYQSKINGNLQKYVSLTVPSDGQGGQIRWKKWTKLKIYFWRPNGQGYSFETKVVAYNTLKGLSSLFVQHANNIKKEQQRRHRRKEINRPAYFFPIKVMTTGTGKTAQKKAVVEQKKGTLSTILDISAGGCALKSNYPLTRGQLVKIDFEAYKGQPISVYGKIQGTNRLKPIGGVMHIQFTKMGRKHLNRINSYVYGLDSGEPKKNALRN